jgi:hypothetical protein
VGEDGGLIGPRQGARRPAARHRRDPGDGRRGLRPRRKSAPTRQPARRDAVSPLRACPVGRRPDTQGRAQRGLAQPGKDWKPRKERATASGRRNSIDSKVLRCSVSTGSTRAKPPSKRRCASRASPHTWCKRMDSACRRRRQINRAGH